MIHLLIKKSDTNDQPILNHFGSVNEMKSFYRDGINGDVIANKKDLEKVIKDNKGDAMIIAMLERINEDELSDIKCDLKEGVCIVQPPKTESALAVG